MGASVRRRFRAGTSNVERSGDHTQRMVGEVERDPRRSGEMRRARYQQEREADRHDEHTKVHDRDLDTECANRVRGG
jgi:hypothetical protein